MKLPKQVKVGAYIYKIIPMKEFSGSGHCGTCNNETLEIRVRTTLSPAQVKNTLLHEILHAVYYHQGMGDSEGEEVVVNGIANGLQMVFHDNPILKRYL